MKLTPLDIRHKEFKRGMRGYADTEVDEFLDEVADEFERLFKENIDYGERVEALEEKIAHYRMIEETLQKTLLSAQQSAEELKQNSTKEGQLILRDAELKARQMVNESYADKQRVEKEMAALRNAEDEFRFRFRSLLEGYLKQLGDIDRGAQERASDFKRQAEALKEAMTRDEPQAAPAPREEARRPAPPASPPEPAASPAPAAAPLASEPIPLRTIDEALAAAEAERESAVEQGAPAPPPRRDERPPAPRERPAAEAPPRQAPPAPRQTQAEPAGPQGEQPPAAPPPAAPQSRPPAAAPREVAADLAPPANTGVAARRVPVEWQVSSADASDTLAGEPAAPEPERDLREQPLAGDPEVDEDDFKW
jgi:cell division initiation protein